MTPAQIEALPPWDRPMAREIARRGLQATFSGHCWRIRGTGVDVSVAKLRYLVLENLVPTV